MINPLIDNGYTDNGATDEIDIHASDRLAFVGKTGSGKTFAAKILASHVPRLVVLDPKGSLKTWNTKPLNPMTRHKLEHNYPVRIRITAPYDGNWEPYLKMCYDAQNVTVYIDEVYGILNRGKQSQALTALYTRGRELGIGVWASTQRPSWIPLFCISEAEWLFLFRLQLEADKRRMASIMGGIVERHELKQHQVFVYNQEWEKPMLFERVSVKGIENVAPSQMEQKVNEIKTRKGVVNA